MGPPVKLVWGLVIGGLRFGFRSPISPGEIDERPYATRLARGIDDGPERCLVAIELSKKSRLPGSRTALPDKIVLHDLPAGDGAGAPAFLGLGAGAHGGDRPVLRGGL